MHADFSAEDASLQCFSAMQRGEQRVQVVSSVSAVRVCVQYMSPQCVLTVPQFLQWFWVYAVSLHVAAV